MSCAVCGLLVADCWLMFVVRLNMNRRRALFVGVCCLSSMFVCRVLCCVLFGMSCCDSRASRAVVACLMCCLLAGVVNYLLCRNECFVFAVRYELRVVVWCVVCAVC